MEKLALWAVRSEVAEHRNAPYRMTLCGRRRIKTHVEVRRAESSAWFDGVLRCRNRACPVCYTSRRVQLAHEVGWVVDQRSNATGRTPVLGTFTVRHSSRDPATISLDVRDCWRRTIRGNPWTRKVREYGLAWIVAEEVTLGPNGWHPHMHALFLPRDRGRLSMQGDGSDVLELRRWLSDRWAGVVERVMGERHRPNEAHGVDLRFCSRSDYITKLGWDQASQLAVELTDSASVKSRSPLQLAAAGEHDRYFELMRARRRARDITFSTELRELRELVPPPPDATIELALRGSEYERLAEMGDPALLDVLKAAGRGEGGTAAAALLGPLQGVPELGALPRTAERPQRQRASARPAQTP